MCNHHNQNGRLRLRQRQQQQQQHQQAIERDWDAQEEQRWQTHRNDRDSQPRSPGQDTDWTQDRDDQPDRYRYRRQIEYWTQGSDIQAQYFLSGPRSSNDHEEMSSQTDRNDRYRDSQPRYQESDVPRTQDRSDHYGQARSHWLNDQRTPREQHHEQQQRQHDQIIPGYPDYSQVYPGSRIDAYLRDRSDERQWRYSNGENPGRPPTFNYRPLPQQRGNVNANQVNGYGHTERETHRCNDECRCNHENNDRQQRSDG